MPDTLVWRAFVGSKRIAFALGERFADADAFVAYVRGNPACPHRQATIRVQRVAGRDVVETYHKPVKQAAA